MHCVPSLSFYGLLLLLYETIVVREDGYCQAFSVQQWHRPQPTTRIHARPQDFSAGKIGIPLPLRGFPMPDDDGDDDEDSLPPPVQSFFPPLQPNPDPSVERAKLTRPQYKPMEPEPPKPPPIGLPQKWEAVPPNFAKPQKKEGTKPNFSLFDPPAKEAAPPAPAEPTVVQKPSFSLFSSPKSSDPVEDPPVESKPSFSLFGSPVEVATPAAPLPPPVVEKQPSLSLFSPTPEPATVGQPAAPPSPPAAVEKQPSFSLFGPAPEPATVEPAPAPPPPPAVEKQPTLSLFSSAPEKATVAPPPAPPVIVKNPSVIAEPSPAVLESAKVKVETPPAPLAVKESLVPPVKKDLVVESTATNAKATSPPAQLIESAPKKATPVGNESESKKMVEKPEPSHAKLMPEPAPPPPSAVEPRPLTSEAKPTPPSLPESSPPPLSTLQSAPSPLQSLLPQTVYLDRITSASVAPLALVPLAALAAGRSLLTSRASKEKDIDDQLKRLEERKQRELTSTNSLVFTVLAVAALSIASLFFSILETGGPVALSSTSTVREIASITTAPSPSAPSAIRDAVQPEALKIADQSSPFSTRTIAGLWSRQGDTEP